MKKWLIAFLCLLLWSCASAEGFQEPALKNPQEAYDFYYDQTDGSEELVYGMIDTMNDEATIVEEYGALHIYNQMYDPSGLPYTSIQLTLQNSLFGRIMISSVEDMLTDIYTIGTRNYMMVDGELVDVFQDGNQEDFDWYWESYCFPYGRLQTLNCVRQDENGYSYYLITSEDYMSFEYVVDSGMKIVQLRVYMRDEDGTLCLDSTVDYEAGKAKAIPPAVLRAMRADFVE